ncbi:MAG TPA: hypothetical protein VGM59_18655 [Dongiaceae bacterium]
MLGATYFIFNRPIAETTVPGWEEPRYNAPVGSHWNLIVRYRRDDIVNGVSTWLTYTINSELTIDAKLDDGYRVTYRNLNGSVDGTDDDVIAMREGTAPLQGVPVEATTDEAGKPLQVDNLAEVQAAMRVGIDHVMDASIDTPEKKAVFRQMLEGMLMLNAQQAADLYLDEVPSLAEGQDTGMKPGEERRSVETSPNPMGGTPMRSNLMLKFEHADSQTGDALYLKTESYDPASVQDLMAAIAKSLAEKQGGDPDQAAEKIRNLMKNIAIDRNEKTELHVEGGMTRRIDSDKRTISSGLGATLNRHEVKTITIMPMQ